MRCLQSADGHFANWNREDVGLVNHSLGTSVIHMPPGGKGGQISAWLRAAEFLTAPEPQQ